MPSRVQAVIAACLLAFIPTLHAEVAFVDVSGARGVLPYTMALGKGSSAAAADYDDDGDIDLFVPAAKGVPDQLYRNRGDGFFDEVASELGLASTANSRIALWLDYDGDRRLDLFVAGDCFSDLSSCPEVSTLHLYRQNADGQFDDVTAIAGLDTDLVVDTTPHRAGVAAGDINNDGYLDLAFGLWAGEARLMLNDGFGRFEDISISSGIGGEELGYWQPVFVDIDGDGWQDIYWAVDFTENKLWLNQRDNTFVDVAVDARADNSWNDMGVALGDYDNDGDFDIYVTNITTGTRYNVLYRNDTLDDDPWFTEVAFDLEVDSAGWSWGATFFDADRDLWLDLAVTNGWFNGPGANDPSKFFRNMGGPEPTFQDRSDESGFNDVFWGSALIAADFDRDGDLDLVQTTNGAGPQPAAVRLLDTSLDAASELNHWLTVRPRMSGANHRAIGAVVRAYVGETQMTRLITAGTSFYGQEPAEAFFGLGLSTVVDRVVVEWPDGTRTERENVPADQVLTVEPQAFSDATAMIGGGTPELLTESVAWGDYDNDGDQDLYLTSDGPNSLWRNDGNGVFVDVTSVAGVGADGFSVGTAFGDLDNDGDLDLYVVSFGPGTDLLYRNDGPSGPGGAYTFSDVTISAGIDDENSSRGLAFLDYDRDGLLDIYVTSLEPDILYRNLGGLTFANVASSLGVDTPGQGVGVVATDLDGNGWPDLFTGNRSFDPNRLYLNDGGTFTDVTTSAGILLTGLGMGVMSFDYDNDLDFDLYWTSWPDAPNALYENLDGAHFTNVSGVSGTTDPDGWGISCNAGDVDNDGFEDFFVTNGFSGVTTPNVLFHNNGNGTFSDSTDSIGGGEFDGRGVAFADYDGDGDVDLLVTSDVGEPSRLWRNEIENDNHWLTLDLEGACSNRSAIGARVEVTTDLRTTAKEVGGGAGRGSQNSLPLEFGLGRASTVDEVRIRWPNGLEETLTGLSMDATVSVTESLLCATPALTMQGTSVEWELSRVRAPETVRYDMVQGALSQLRASAGDFGVATQQCVVSERAETTIEFAGTPRPGNGLWFLVRPVTTVGVGSWDSPAASQVASRDAGIDGSTGACP